ncbi:MAG: aldo/keto reductase [Planctomycetales bacterium]|nr:aldo/keto reductase [Planctomycetales bacterium]
MAMRLRPLGKTGLRVSPVALGCWPISGMTSLGVSEAQSLATLEACFDEGINFLDTAYCYGAEGESERLIRRAVADRRDSVVIATKGGIAWDADRKQVFDASAATLRRQCDESLRRLDTDRVELYYLHAPDPNTPIEESAAAIRALIDDGKVRSAGLSNCTIAQAEAFASVCPLAAIQPPYNLLQRDIENDLIPWCLQHNVSLIVYWPLMKGLLAGKLPRDHVFDPQDGRAKYPMFQGDEWQKNQDLVDALREIASAAGRTVAELTVAWTIRQPGITSALCGAKRPDQIRETAGGARWELREAEIDAIDAALARRGQPVTRWAVARN